MTESEANVADDPRHIEFEYAPSDFAAFYRYQHFITPSAKKRRFRWNLITVAVTSALPITVFMASDRPYGEAVTAIWPLICAPIFATLFLLASPTLFTWLVLQTMANAGDGNFGTTRLKIAGEGIPANYPNMTCSAPWSSVNRIGVTDDYAFAYISESQAFIVSASSIRVPRRVQG
jgi:hypothetical protein